MNYIEQFMRDNHLEINQPFHIANCPLYAETVDFHFTENFALKSTGGRRPSTVHSSILINLLRGNYKIVKKKITINITIIKKVEVELAI